MTSVARFLLTAALLGATALAVTRPAAAQNWEPADNAVLPPPRSDAPPPPTAVPAQAVPGPVPFPAAAPAPPDARDPLYQPQDPGINGWGPYGLPSWPEHFFGDVEIDILKPHLKASLTNPVVFPDGSQTNVAPPTTQVGWTAAPMLELGWFIPPSLGFFALNWRGFVSDGQQNAVGLDGMAYALRTRLDVNQAALDFGTVPYSYAPRWFVAGRIGIAASDVFFDNRAVSAAQELYASNNYYGAGPHVRLDLWREFALIPGLSAYAQGDLYVYVGQIHQRYRQDNFNADGSTTQGTYTLRKTQTVPVLFARTGLQYAPSRLPCWRFTLGYEFEEWWFVGQVDMLPTRGQFNTNGVFLRAFASF